MDNRTEIRDFLTSRRAKLSLAWAGLPIYGGNPARQSDSYSRHLRSAQSSHTVDGA